MAKKLIKKVNPPFADQFDRFVKFYQNAVLDQPMTAEDFEWFSQQPLGMKREICQDCVKSGLPQHLVITRWQEHSINLGNIQMTVLEGAQA